MLDGMRVTDPDFGFELFTHLKILSDSTLVTHTDGHEVIVEAFDEALVAQRIDKHEDRWIIQMPYNFKAEVQTEAFSLDEWDRFHGRTPEGLPFVLSRPAQASFFDLVDEFDDDSITVNGKKFVLPFWPSESAAVEKENFWTDIYQTESEPGWDLKKVSPVIEDALKQLKLPKMRVLVLGAGRGHDAVHFAKQGHLVTAVDFSPKAYEQFKEIYGTVDNLQYLVQDTFKLDQSYKNSFDLIVDHTHFCAINPRDRKKLVKLYKTLLTDEGMLLAVFFAMDRKSGPPFGSTEWELQQRLNESFQLLYWTRCKNSVERRLGKELLVVGRKK